MPGGAQSLKRGTLDLGSGRDLTVREFEPLMGSALTAWSPLGILSLSPLASLSVPLPDSCCLFFLSLKINKPKEKKKRVLCHSFKRGKLCNGFKPEMA